jgi:hypothetical protein
MSPRTTSVPRPERGVSRALRLLREAESALRVPSPESVGFAASRVQAAIAAFAPVVDAAAAAPAGLRPRAQALSRRIQRLKAHLQPALQFWYNQHLLRFGGAAYGPSAPPSLEPGRSWNG